MSKIGDPEWKAKVIKAAVDNRANQRNPNNAAYWSSRAADAVSSEKNVAVIAVAAATVAVAAAGIYLLHRISKKKDRDDEPDDIF